MSRRRRARRAGVAGGPPRHPDRYEDLGQLAGFPVVYDTQRGEWIATLNGERIRFDRRAIRDTTQLSFAPLPGRRQARQDNIMILGLPDIDTTDLTWVRQWHEQVAAGLTRLEQRTAGLLLRHLFGAVAATALAGHTVDAGDSTDITLLVVLTADERVLWFHPEYAFDFPGAVLVSDSRVRPNVDITGEARYTIEDHLERAYDAAGGCTHALEPVDARTLPFENVLALRIPAAVGDDTPAQELAHDGSSHPQRGPLTARTRDVLVRVIRDIRTTAYTPEPDPDSMLAGLAGDVGFDHARVRIGRDELPLLDMAAAVLDPRT